MTIRGAIEQVQRVIGGLTGIKSAPEFPPGNLPAGALVSVAFEGPGVWTIGPAGYRKWVGEIVVDLYDTTGSDIPSSVARLLPFGESIPNALMAALLADYLNGQVDHFEDISSSGITSFTVAEKVYRGYQFRIRNVKIQSAIG